MGYTTVHIRNEQDLDKHVRWCIANYDGLFTTRQDVLHHIFMVTGGGYDWEEDGSLSTFQDLEEKWNGEPIKPPVPQIPHPDILTREPYPGSYKSYCIYAEMPENAHPDLRSAAEEAMKAVKDWRNRIFDPSI